MPGGEFSLFLSFPNTQLLKLLGPMGALWTRVRNYVVLTRLTVDNDPCYSTSFSTDLAACIFEARNVIRRVLEAENVQSAFHLPVVAYIQSVAKRCSGIDTLQVKPGVFQGK